MSHFGVPADTSQMSYANVGSMFTTNIQDSGMNNQRPGPQNGGEHMERNTVSGSIGQSGLGGIDIGLGIDGGAPLTYAAPMRSTTISSTAMGFPMAYSVAGTYQNPPMANHPGIGMDPQHEYGDYSMMQNGGVQISYPLVPREVISHSVIPSAMSMNNGQSLPMKDHMPMEPMGLRGLMSDLDAPTMSGSNSSAIGSMPSPRAPAGQQSPGSAPGTIGAGAIGDAPGGLNSYDSQSDSELTMVTFNAKLDAYANFRPHALINEALDLLKRARAQGLNPDHVTFNGIIKAAANANPARVDVATDMLKRMAFDGFRPDLTTYTGVLEACAKAKPADADNAKVSMDAMRLQNIEPTEDTYNHVIDAYVNAVPPHVDLAVQELGNMVQAGITPKESIYTKIAGGCAKSQFPDGNVALDILVRMEKSGLEPSSETLSSVLAACANTVPPLLDDVRNLLNRMNTSAMIPDQFTYSNVVYAYAMAQPPQIDEALSILSIMRNNTKPANQTAYTAVIQALSSATPPRLDEAKQLLNNMVVEGVEPSQVAYSVVIKACSDMRPAEIDQAADLLEEMLSRKVPVDTRILTSLLRCCTYTEPPNPKQAEKLFKLFLPLGHVFLDAELEEAVRLSTGPRADELLNTARRDYPSCLRPPLGSNQLPFDASPVMTGMPQQGLNSGHVVIGMPFGSSGAMHPQLSNPAFTRLPNSSAAPGVNPSGVSRYGFAYEEADTGLDYELGKLSLEDEEAMHSHMSFMNQDRFANLNERTKKVFAGGLPPNATEDSVKESFSVFGNVTEVLLMYDRKMQRFRGFGYITFDSPDAVEQLCQRRFVQIDGKQVEIKAAQPKAAMDAQRKISGFRAGTVDARTDAMMKTKKIFCGGLPPSTTEESIKAVFEKYGAVTEVLLMYDKLIIGDNEVQRFRGFGYITFDSTDPVEHLCRERFLDVDGKQVEIKAALPKAAMDAQKKLAVSAALMAHRQVAATPANAVPVVPKTRKIFCGGLPPSTTEESVKTIFSQYGEVAEVLLMYDRELQRFRGFGYITFTSEEPVEMLCQAHYIEIGGKQVEIKAAQPKVQMEAQRMLGAQRDSTRRNGRGGGDRRGRGNGNGPGSRGMQGPQQQRGICRAFQSPEGCRFGNKCHYQHK